MAKIISSLPGSAGVLSKTSQLINDGESGVSTYVELNDLSTVATTGDYNNLINIPIDFTPKVHTHNISDISGTKSEFNTSLTDGDFLFVGDVLDTPDATVTTKGILKLTGDLGGTADLPTVPNKLDKGTYPGTAQDLKEDIDNIYVPDTVIRTTEPTRVGNVFTFPVDGYEVLLNKTRRSNTAAFVTTIAAATTDYKRVDLIYFKPDNTLDKIQGVESLTVAVRPDAPVGSIAVSFINVFGATIEAPTPVDNDISFQNSQGQEIFKGTFLRVKGASLNAAQHMIEISPLVSNRIFLTSHGNDSTAEAQDQTKPFKTLNAVVIWMLSQGHKGFDWYIETLDNGTFTYDLNMRGVAGLGVFLRGFNIINASGARIVMANNIDIREQYIFNFPNGILEYNYTDSSVTVSYGCFMDNQVLNFKHDVGTVEFKTSRTDGGTLSRGFHRSFSANLNTNYINWGTVNYYNGCSNFADAYPSSVRITINILNNYNTILFFRNFTANYYISMNYLSINSYVNQTSVNQEIFASNLEITSISSVNALTVLSYVSFSLKSHASFTNTVFKKVYASTTYSPVINGNGFSLNLSYTIASDFYLAGSGNSYKTGSDQLSDKQNEIKNITINCSGTFSKISTIDLRSGRFGEQYLFDNVNLNFATSSPLFQLDNFQTLSAGYQVIFRNSVNIKNNHLIFNGGIVGGGSPLSISKNFIIQENASIYHDFAKIHNNGNFPPINQHNTYNNIRRNELRVSIPLQVIGGAIRSDYTYVVDGVMNLSAGQYIVIPEGGATIIGYGFDVSKIVKNVAGESIFTGTGIGNLVMKDLTLDSGLGSVFNLTDSNATHAIEFNDVNFENCTSLGTLKNFRQFTGNTIGVYGCLDGLMLSGTWNGFILSKLHVRSFSSAGTLFKKNTDTSFSNRFALGVNLSCSLGTKILDFDNTIFTKDETFQLDDCTIEVDGVISAANTASLIPNISPNDPKCRWVNSTGIQLSAVKFQDIKSPDGNVWRLSVDNSGVITATDI